MMVDMCMTELAGGASDFFYIMDQRRRVNMDRRRQIAIDSSRPSTLLDGKQK